MIIIQREDISRTRWTQTTLLPELMVEQLIFRTVLCFVELITDQKEIDNLKKIPYEKSLEYFNPELAKQWHPKKNGDLKPTDVTVSSNKKAWWYLPYDDPVTGKHYDFEWEAIISKRSTKGGGCPFLSGQSVWPSFNDLASKRPDAAKMWHPKKNGDLKSTEVTLKSEIRIWWYLPYDDPVKGTHFDFEWESRICDVTDYKNSCPYLSGQAIWPGYNDLASNRPKVAKQWHPKKNGDLKPTDVTVSSNKKVWWYLLYDDPATGKHFDFEWEAVVADRDINGLDCPYITGHKVWTGFNDLMSRKPEKAKEWHPTKNGDLRPSEVRYSSGLKVWWYLPYDDPDTGNHYDFEWKSSINSRTSKNLMCPFINNKLVWAGFNDLAFKRPDVAKMWHPTKNKNLKSSEVTVSSNKKVWWFLPYDDLATGKHFDFEWQAVISSITFQGQGCPYLSGKAVWKGYNDLVTVFPELSTEWHPVKNRLHQAEDFTAYSGKKVWWMCKKGHEWYTSICNRAKGNGCPQCRY